MKNFTLKIFISKFNAFLLCLLCFCCTVSNAQVTIWSDDFSVAANWTMTGGSPTNWTIGQSATGAGGFPLADLLSTSNAPYALWDSDNHGSGIQDASITMANPISTVGYPDVEIVFENLFRPYTTTAVYVEVSTDGITFPNQYQVHASIPSNGSTANPETTSVDISAAAGNQAQVWVRFRYTGNWDYGWAIDDVEIRQPNNCVDPSMLTASNFTDDSADLAWTENGTATAWDIEIVTIGTSPTGTATASGVTNPYTAMGLTQNTTYDYYVKADCGVAGTSAWVGPFSFTTACSEISTFPSTTDFTNHLPSACWNDAGDGESNAIPLVLGSSNWAGGRAYTNDIGVVVNSNVMNLFQGNVDREWLLSPTYNIPSGTPHGIQVTVALTDTSISGTSTATDTDTMGSDDEVKLLMTVDNGATWTELTTWNAGNQPAVTGTMFLADITAVSGNVRFAVWASDGVTDDTEDYDFHVGEFTVDTLVALGIESFSTNTLDFNHYPNPVNDILTINSKTDITSVEVLNLLGQKVKTIKNSSISVNVDMSDLSQGAYFVKVVSGDFTKTIKIIKK